MFLFYNSYYPQMICVQSIQLTQTEIQKQNNISEYADAICGNIRSYRDSIKNQDYNLAISTTEQIIEGSLKMVAINEGNLTQDLEESHDLLSLRKLNVDVFHEFSNNKMRKARRYYYRKYPNYHAHTTEDEALEAGKLATKVADVAFEKVGIQGCDLDRELGKIDSEKVNSIDDYNIWNRLSI